MSSTKQRIRLMGALAALATLALAISCRGFFVPPTLISISVGPPAPTIETGTTNNTVQMFATGTYNGGSGTPPVTWSISPSDGSIATITPGGLVTAVSAGSAVVTATSTQNTSLTGTQTVTVNLGGVTGLTLDSTTYTISAPNNTVNAFAYATVAGNKVDVSATATWTTGSNSTATVQGGTDPVVITGVATGTTTVTATYVSGGTTYTATANVNVN